MKKFLVCSIAAMALAVSLSACADTMSGKVVKTDGQHMVVQQKDGSQATLKTTEDTIYRKKKMEKHANKHHTAKKHAQPMVVEDDFVEVIYSPANNEWIVEEVTIWTE